MTVIRRRQFMEALGGVAALACGGRAFAAAAPTVGLRLSPPTAQKVLDGSLLQGVFMDTGTGRPESGMFGNTRKYADGSPRFHEGIDIAPVQPWRRNQDPTDLVRAAAPGLLVYVNRQAENPSLYGNYAVMTHSVPGFGEVYTLYAHLRCFCQGIRAGLQLRAGEALGVMGHTPDFPLARAHLHFEIGVMMNRFYYLIDPQHGIWNGANLYGIDPCHAFAEQRRKGFFDIASYIRSRPRAWAKVLPPMRSVPDFFRRYPSLWHAPRHAEWRTLVSFSREGIPISATSLDPAVRYKLKLIDPQVLATGRNWADAKRGQVLIENLLVSPETASEEFSKMGEVGWLEKGGQDAYSSRG